MENNVTTPIADNKTYNEIRGIADAPRPGFVGIPPGAIGVGAVNRRKENKIKIQNN